MSNKTIKFDLLRIREKKTCPGDLWPTIPFSKGFALLQHPNIQAVEVEQTFANQIYFDSQSVPTIIFNLHLNVSFSIIF